MSLVELDEPAKDGGVVSLQRHRNGLEWCRNESNEPARETIRRQRTCTYSRVCIGPTSSTTGRAPWNITAAVLLMEGTHQSTEVPSSSSSGAVPPQLSPIRGGCSHSDTLPRIAFPSHCTRHCRSREPGSTSPTKKQATERQRRTSIVDT